jgi:hypothetical protein
MKTLKLKNVMMLCSVLCCSMASAGEVVFSADRSSYDFDAANAAGSGFVGYFEYDSTLYGVDQNNFDFSTAAAGYSRYTKAQTVDEVQKNVIYRFYNQTYSTVIGNIVQGADQDRQFIQGVVGEATPESALTASTTYVYDGVAFNHNLSGDFDYALNVSADGVVTGSGSISNISGNRPTYGAFELSGELDTVTFTSSATTGLLESSTGTTTLNLYNVGSGTTDTYTDSVYSVGVYGPNADEVAGGIYDGEFEEVISGFGLAGTLTSTTTTE